MNTLPAIHYWEIGQQRHAIQYARALMTFANGKVQSVLDVGAGDGIVSKIIGEASGSIYQGIDVGANIYERTSLVQYVCDVTSILSSIPKMKAEAVLALDVLEHVDDFDIFARAIFSSSLRFALISLPNEMSVHVRSAFLLGRGVPCHGLSMVLAEEGHRHRWLISYSEAKAYFLRLASDMNFELIGEVHITILPRSPWKRFLLKPLLSVLPLSLRSHGFAFVFKKM